MQRALPILSIEVWRLAPFVIVSLLVHVALLLVIHLPTSKLSISQQRPMSVNFVAQTKPVILDKVPTAKHNTPPQLMSLTKRPVNPQISQPYGSLSIDTPPFFNAQQLLESSKIAARDEGRRIEQYNAILEKNKPTTPASLLEQYLRQPHKEIRLANGTLKIITSMGEFCFQPVPYFARDNASTFAVSTTCP
jgi:hypothetical protein